VSLTEPAAAPLDGYLLVDKPAGLTSQQVVSRVKRTLGVRKAGHAGTLDPMATGLLIVGLGKATRLLGYLSGDDKQYEATIRLGQATTSDDAEGEPLAEPVDATGLSDQVIADAIDHYRGAIDQVPSAVSAIKVAGQRAYALVRSGQAVDLPARPVRIDRFVVEGRTDTAGWVDLAVRIDCSTGTYIRALARDLGRDLGVGGHITQLRRIRVGQFEVANAVGLDDVTPTAVGDLATLARAVAPSVEVDPATARAVTFGQGIPLDRPGLTSIFGAGQFLGLYRPAADRPGWATAVAIMAEPERLATGVNDV